MDEFPEGGNHQLGSFFVCSYALPKASENGAEKGTTPDLPLGRSIGGVVVGLASSDSAFLKTSFLALDPWGSFLFNGGLYG